MTQRTPLVSVGVPVYNGEDYLRQALDGWLAQDLDDFEVIVCDNASTDSTPEIAKEYVARDPRFRYHRNPRNLGLSGNFNKAFELARGKYFKWAAHDDLHPPQTLRVATTVLERDPAAVICASAVAIMDDDGEVFDEFHPTVDLRSAPPHVRFHRIMWTLEETHPLFAVMRSDALRRTRLYQPFVGGDRALLAQMALMGSIWQVPEVLHYYRQPRMSAAARQRTNRPSQAVILDPANEGKPPSRTWRLCTEHLRLVREADLSVQHKLWLTADVLARYGVRDSRRLAAEAYHAGRILAGRALSRSSRGANAAARG
jgi:glycosyltransferase involved in cell wall biosynthesis